jgi:hypothetical protein
LDFTCIFSVVFYNMSNRDISGNLLNSEEDGVRFMRFVPVL